MRDTVTAFKALSDETRLRILCLLLESECCVCEVMQALEISQTRASRNLSILYNAGFLSMRRDGLYTVYSIHEDKKREYFSHLIEVLGKELGDYEVIIQDRERLRKAERVGRGYKCL